MPQLSDIDKATALALREAGWKQIDVARRLGVDVKTIRRLEEAARTLKPGVVPSRKPGTGLKNKKYGAKEVKIIEKLCKDNPGITALQLKMRRPKQLGHLSRRTLSDIVWKEVGLKSCVRAKKPHMTEAKMLERKTFAAKHRKWSKSKWGQYLFADEAFFWTKNQLEEGGCGDLWERDTIQSIPRLSSRNRKN